MLKLECLTHADVVNKTSVLQAHILADDMSLNKIIEILALIYFVYAGVPRSQVVSYGRQNLRRSYPAIPENRLSTVSALRSLPFDRVLNPSHLCLVFSIHLSYVTPDVTTI